MADIEVRELSRYYKRGDTVVRALDGVSLTIRGGEFISIVGRSGSGKTTTLDLLGLLLRPTGGQILIDGTDAGKLSDGKRADLRGQKIGFIFQEFNLLPGLNALENVMLPLRYQKRDKDGKKRAAELLDEVGLKDRMRHRPDQMSGGEQQRVAIARSLINRPSLVLGDEPTGEVDTETSQQLVSLMRRMNKEHGVTFVIVTHDVDVSAQTDRTIRLKDGKVLSDVRADNEQAYLAQLDLQHAAQKAAEAAQASWGTIETT
jgi:ABC-type lipoprotein export system ATPase subunit